MIATVTDESVRKFSKDGSILKYLRSVGGIAFGCLVAGMVLLVLALILGSVFFARTTLAGGLLFGGMIGIPGLILVVCGAAARSKRLRQYLSYYQKDTGFSMDELQSVDRELMARETLLIYDKQPQENKKNSRLGCFLTKHYVVIPLIAGTCYVRRIQDMAAVFYSEEIPGIDGYKHGLVFLSSHDDTMSFNALLTKNTCMEIIQTLHQLNPKIIREQRFEYDGRRYDLVKNWQDVLSLFRDNA